MSKTRRGQKIDISIPEKSYESRERALVVLSGDSFFWTIWCLEYAISLQKKGFKVDFLDLSRFRTSRFGHIVSDIKSRVLFRNSMNKLLPKICRETGISLIRLTPRKKYSSNSSSMSPVETQKYLSLLDGELAPITGIRLKATSDVPPKVLSRFNSYYFQTKSVVTQLHKNMKYELIATSNGRLIVGGAVAQAALEAGISIKVIDTPITARWTYEIFSNNFLENLHFLANEIQTTWLNAGASRETDAQIGLNNKLMGRKLHGQSWSHDFELEIPTPYSTNAPLAVLFPTTDLEIPLHELTSSDAAFGGSQETAFKEFCIQAKRLGYKIVLRAHPHPGNIARASMENRIWSHFCNENEITFIGSESRVNSYELMKQSDLNVSYYSTTAIDSIILQRRTLILGFTEFSPLVPEICAYSSKQISTLLENDVPILGIERIYPWSYYQERGARSLESFEIDSRRELSFRGTQLNVPRIKIFNK